MPIKDLRSNVKVEKILNAVASAAATTVTTVYDSVDDEAVFFTLAASVVTAVSLSISKIEEDDVLAFSSPNDVAADKIIGNFVNTAIVPGDLATKASTIGVFSTKRFLRVEITAVTPGGGNDFIVLANSEPHLLPAINPED